MKNTCKREHFYVSVDFILSFSLIFVLSIIRRIFTAPQSLFDLILYNGLDFLLLALIISGALMRYFKSGYKIDTSSVKIRRGFFLKSKFSLNTRDIPMVSLSASPLERLLNTRKINFICSGKGNTGKKYQLFLSRRGEAEIVRKIFPDNKKCIYRAKIKNLILLVLTGSDTASGILLFAASIRRAGKIIGDEYAKLLYEQIDPQKYIIALGAKPLFAALAGVLILGLLFTVLYKFITNYDFTLFKGAKTLVCKRGHIWKYRTYIKKKAISFIQLEKTFFMQKAGYASVKYFIARKNGIKGVRNIAIPSDCEKQCRKFIDDFYSDKTAEVIKILPPQKAAVSYSLFPASMIVITLILIYLILWLYGPVKISITFLYALLFFELLWLMFRIDLINHVSITVRKDTVTVNTFKHFKLISAKIPLSNITDIVIEQNPFQRRENSFHISIYVNVHKLRAKHLICSAENFELIKEIL